MQVCKCCLCTRMVEPGKPMTRDHPRWPEFTELLAARAGSCTSAPFYYPISNEILAAMGFDDEGIFASEEYFLANGGHCECEILYNIAWRDEPVTDGEKH